MTQRFTQDQIDFLINSLISNTLSYTKYHIDRDVNVEGRITLQDNMIIEWRIRYSDRSDRSSTIQSVIIELLNLTYPKTEEREKQNDGYNIVETGFHIIKKIIGRHSFNLTNGALGLRDDIEITNEPKISDGEDYLKFLNIVRNFLKSEDARRNHVRSFWNKS